MKPLSRLGILSIVLLVCVGADQWTKVLAQQYLRGRPVQSFLNDIARLQYSENPGAFLSLGSGLSDSSRFWVLTVIVGLVLVGAVLYLILTPKLSKLSTHALAWTVAGGVSNLLDRSFRTGGVVVDFMNLGVGPLRTGIFNIADMAIMAGVGLLILDLSHEKKEITTRAS